MDLNRIPFVQAKNYYKGGRRSFDRIVIHDAEYPEYSTAAEWVADFFAGRNGLTAPQASADFAVDDNSIVRMIAENDAGWHTPGSLNGQEINRTSIGIEHAGYAKQTHDQWLDAYGVAMLELSAELTATLCAKYNIPVLKLSVEGVRLGARGICGHVDCTKATGKGTHYDPGPGFPWDWYIERVKFHFDLLHNLGIVSQEGAPPIDDFIEVECNGERWSVSPIYIWPVGIGQAAELVRSLGPEFSLPNKDLVDAIWRAADLKIDANEMVKRDHDGTPKTMASIQTFNEQATKLEKLIANRPYKLLAGYCKDIIVHEGKIGLYGWQQKDGSVIQEFYSGHARGWIDYSQGVRLCRRIG